MSERESEQGPAESRTVPVEPSSTLAAEPAGPPHGPPPDAPSEPPREPVPRSPRAAVWLAGVLILILAGVALSPFWAPQIAPLFPWGENRAEYAALAARVAVVETRPVPPGADIDAVRSATSALARRVDQIQTTLDTRLAELAKHPAAPSADIDAINSALGGLAHRVDRLDAAANADRQLEGAVAAARAGVQQIEQRLAAIETQSASSVSQVANEAAAVHDTEQELARLGKLAADLADRVTALEREEQSQSGADLRAGGILALLLEQMREAMEQARPFPAEFNAFINLARGSDLAAAAEPLAEAARNGAASRGVLVKRLAEVAGQVATASQPAGESDWGAQALARLRGLVTIRRIDGPSQTGPEAAVSAAQAALARGDLAGAIAALDPLTGANAEAARPWLRMAHERLAAEAALDHLQELLIARLGSPPAAAPPKAPDEPSEKARTRS